MKKIVPRLSVVLDKLNDGIIQIFKTFFQGVRKHWAVILTVLGILLLLTLLGVILILHYAYGMVWVDWTGFGDYTGPLTKDQRGKTLWDWLGLLIIPTVLALAAFYFNRQERRNELKIAEDRRASDLEIAEERRASDLEIAKEQREKDLEIADRRNQDSVLQNYLDKMNDLILEKHLMEVKRCRDEAAVGNPSLDEQALDALLPPDLRPVWDMAQIRTVTALRQLNAERRDFIIHFLRDADLADFLLAGASLIAIDLSETYMTQINLSGAKLYNANLTNTTLIRVNLRKAHLHGAILNGAVLFDADLRDAILIGANFSGANLNWAKLSGANLGIAILSGANLSGAKLTKEQWVQAESLEGAIMPDGKVFDPAVHLP